MNILLGRIAVLGLFSLLGAPALPSILAKPTEWKDQQGKTFRGEPTEILGPFVIFRTGTDKGSRVLLRAFSEADCRRIYAEIAARPPRAETLALATGAATSELRGNVLQVRNGTIQPADLTSLPEPELLMVLSGSHNDGEGWYMSNNLGRFYRRIQNIYPDRLEAVFLGTRHDAPQHRNIAVHTNMPWLVSDLAGQGALMRINGYLPRQGANVVLVSRQGVPLVAARAGEARELCGFLDRTAELLWMIDPANPAGWPDRLHYLKATRPVQYAQGRADPVLVGDPLRPDMLRRYGVKRVVAHLTVDASGQVSATLRPGPADMPAELVAPLTAALANVVVAPAIERGQAVAGTLDYLLEVLPADPARDAEQAWLVNFFSPNLAIDDWLLLRPIKVSEQDFTSSVVGKTAEGVLILNSLEVNSSQVSRRAQLSAFNSDWFAGASAQSVHPQAGEEQRIDAETVLRWEKVRSVDGLVNMQSGVARDYTVGYAWAEFASPRESAAWLALGSDDGVKIWLNGKLVHDKWIRRPSLIDDDIISLRLRPGKNRLLIKIQNAKADWSFFYRLRLAPGEAG